MPKRLIVCCDGTWQDATDDTYQPPTNVTRLTRALRSTALVKENGETQEVPQIVYYQKGVGTGMGDKVWGGLTGVGVSANVRAAYAFLADNYSEGDKIYFFGFSRGAYTARAIAGLVCEWGLLTKRGMDNFAMVYDDFYKRKIPSYTDEQRRRMGFRDPLPRFTIEVVGVWDTVAFHQPCLGTLAGEELEFRNTILSREVHYAYHALSLDERRTAYQPTMFHVPDDADGQELLQVWFSGVHSDVGGGMEDPQLSNITLAWMIAQCTKHDQLSFDIDGYLFHNPPLPIEAPDAPWGTVQGEANPVGLSSAVQGVLGGFSDRTPLAYDQPGEEQRPTNEMIHVSIKDRLLKGSKDGAERWSSSVVSGRKDETTWALKDGKELVQTEPLDAELYMKGRIRTVHATEED